MIPLNLPDTLYGIVEKAIRITERVDDSNVKLVDLAPKESEVDIDLATATVWINNAYIGQYPSVDDVTNRLSKKKLLFIRHLSQGNLESALDALSPGWSQEDFNHLQVKIIEVTLKIQGCDGWGDLAQYLRDRFYVSPEDSVDKFIEYLSTVKDILKDLGE